MIIGFEVSGRPFPKQRPRTTKTGRTYTPAKTALAEKAIKNRASEFFSGFRFAGPVHVDIIFVFKPAKSWSKKRTQKAIGQPHEQCPDVDNLSKLVCDALNGIAYVDDKQVAKCTSEKVWGLTERTIISIYPHKDTWRDAADAAQLSVDEVLDQITNGIAAQ